MGEKKIVRLVIDTNVVISGLLFGGIPGRIIDLSTHEDMNLLISRDIIDEYLKVLSYPKFKLSEDEIHYLLYHILLPNSEVVETGRNEVAIIADDPSDDKFLMCSVDGRADYLISGDTHLTSLGRYRQTRIVNPKAFLRDVLDAEGKQAH